MNKKFQESSNIFYSEKCALSEYEKNLILTLHSSHRADKYLVIGEKGVLPIILYSDDKMTKKIKEETQEVRPELPLCTPDLAGAALTSLITSQLPQLELLSKNVSILAHPLPSVVWDILSIHYSPVPDDLEKSNVCIAQKHSDGFNYWFCPLS